MTLKTFITHQSEPNEMDQIIEGVQFKGDSFQIGVQLEVTYFTKITLNSDAYGVKIAELSGLSTSGVAKLDDSFTLDVSGAEYLGSIKTVTVTWLTIAFPNFIFFLTNCKVEFNNTADKVYTIQSRPTGF